MIKQEAEAKTALATDVLLALEELQKVVDKKQDVVMGCAPYTAILWSDGRLRYKSYFKPDEMTWTDGLLIGGIGKQTRESTWHDRIVPRLDQEGLDKISRAWVSALTGLESRQVSIDLANGSIPAHYSIEGLEINPAIFVGEFFDQPADPTDEAYLDLLETQLETLMAPLSDPGLSLEQARDFCGQVWRQQPARDGPDCRHRLARWQA